MQQILIKVIMFSLALLFQNNVIADQRKTCNEVKQIISNFISSKKEADWNSIENSSFKYQYCKCELLPVFYFEHWLKIALPNSQSLIGVSPDDFVKEQKKQLNNQLKIMKNCSKESFLPLVEVMIKQQFDISIKKGAEDLRKYI